MSTTVVPACMLCKMCRPGAYENHERTLDLLELELGMLAEPSWRCLGSNLGSLGDLNHQAISLTLSTFCFEAGTLPEPRAYQLATLASQKVLRTCLPVSVSPSLPFSLLPSLPLSTIIPGLQKHWRSKLRSSCVLPGKAFIDWAIAPPHFFPLKIIFVSIY